MKIKELPQWLQDIAMQRCEECCTLKGYDFSIYTNKNDLVSAFVFEETIEGYEFWYKIWTNETIPTQEEYNKKHKK